MLFCFNLNNLTLIQIWLFIAKNLVNLAIPQRVHYN